MLEILMAQKPVMSCGKNHCNNSRGVKLAMAVWLAVDSNSLGTIRAMGTIARTATGES